MNLNRLAAGENWFRIGCKADLARVRTHKLPMAVLWLVVFCIFPSANRAQVPLYEVTPVESTIKFGVDSSVPIKGTFEWLRLYPESTRRLRVAGCATVAERKYDTGQRKSAARNCPAIECCHPGSVFGCNSGWGGHIPRLVTER